MTWLVPAALAALFASGPASLEAASGAEILTFASLDPGQKFTLSGALVVPEHGSGPAPAVVILHATGGVDGTGAFYRGALNAAGVATFEVDFKTGIFTSSTDRPEPDFFLPASLAALAILRARPGIDPDRIGVLGFSLGAILAINSMDDAIRRRWLGARKGFAAYAALYPDCRYLARTLSGKPLQHAPLVVFYGALDSYRAADYCPILESDLRGRIDPAPTFVVYPDAHHGFDRPGPPATYPDPRAADGRGHIEFNAKDAEDARAKVTAFFGRWLAGSR